MKELVVALMHSGVSEEYAKLAAQSLEDFVNRLIEEKLAACAKYAKGCSMPDVASCFQRRYVQ